MPEAKAGGDTLRRGVVSIGPVKQGARAKRRQPRPTSRRSSAETPSSKRLGGHKPEFGAGIGEPRRTCQGGDFTVDNGSAPGRPEVGNAVETKIEPGLRNPIRRLLRSRCQRAAHRLGEECRAATQRQGRNRIRQAHHHQAATDSAQGSQACWDERRAVRLRQVLPAPRPDRPAGRACFAQVSLRASGEPEARARCLIRIVLAHNPPVGACSKQCVEVCFQPMACWYHEAIAQ